MIPDYECDGVRLFNCDCALVMPLIERECNAVISDPPYGCKNNCDYTRFSGGLSPSRNYHEGIEGDDAPFDPTPLLRFPKVVLFGFQFFGALVPVGSVLVWVKKRPNQLGTFLSDGELAWMKGGKGCYVFNHVWHGFDRETERGRSLHPTQKPVALMDWAMRRAKVGPGDCVADPYLGSGATAIACLRLGIPFVGCEISPTYFSQTVARVEAERLERGQVATLPVVVGQ